MKSQEQYPKTFSFEFFPPKTEKGEALLQRTLATLEPLGPEFASVTYGAGGSTREPTFTTVDYIRRSTALEAVPHLTCIGSSEDTVRAILSRYRSDGIRRIVALRGDLPEGADPEANHFRNANELVAFIRAFGGFEIHVACYPEFHPESPDPRTDVDNFVRKADAGADVAITQYFFNNAAYYAFVDDLERRGVRIPVIAGLMPITQFAQIDRFSSMCGADIPLWIRKRMEACGEDAVGQRELGIEIATRQAEDLLANGAPGLHFYTLNKAEATRRVWDNLALGEARGSDGARVVA
ncbi:MAG: methylenetetrahydrofolate reductase [NAD(P)H] [Chromatiales bacterium]|jgi:methylenetetrahydrofolate reductase (NADPH)